MAAVLVIGALAAAVAILALRGPIPVAPVVGLGVASATVVLGVLEVANGSFTWGVWPWIAGGGLQAGGHAWILIRARPSAP